ncbi:MAG TPA: plastocyanin/azurin family copper-binding protein, partial [Chthoniobacterales bacterium]|nr:plastocyanin/azurin family copper-binding protein [Chthoniobacterales bacterium]
MSDPNISSAARYIVAAILLTLASSGMGNARAANVTVDVGANGSLMFSPSTVTIEPGDDVQWVWKSGGHSVISGMPGAPTGQFNSGLRNGGATFSQTFPSAGTVNYYCGPHGGCCQMVGTIHIQAATPTPTPTATPT